MTRALRQAQMEPAFVLHQRPFRDTSRIVEVFSREHGRLSLFARGVRGSKRGAASLLQPFRPLLISFRGRGEAAYLGAVEPAPDERFAGLTLPPAHVMAGFYLNELVLKLTTRDDPQPALFDDYATTIARLMRGGDLETSLRIFEKRLLDALGYGVDLLAEAQSGRAIEPRAHYVFRPAHGLALASADASGAVTGRSMLGLAHESFAAACDVDDARRVLRAALDHCLEGRELTTRAVARAVIHKER